MYSGIRLGMLLGLVLLTHVRCSGNIVAGPVGSSLNVKSDLGDGVRPQEILGQDFFRNPHDRPSSSYSLSQRTHDSLVAPGLAQPLPRYGHASSYQASRPPKNVWPASSSSTLFKTKDSEYYMHELQYSSGSEPLKPYRSKFRSNTVSSGGITLRPETGSSQGFVEPPNLSGPGKPLAVYSARPHHGSYLSQSSTNIWAGTTASSSFQSEALRSSSAEEDLSKPSFTPVKPSRSSFTASSGAIRLVDAANPPASDKRALTNSGSQTEPIRFGSPAQQIGSTASTQNGTLASNCPFDIPSHYGQGIIRRCSMLSSTQDFRQNQVLFSQKNPARSVIVPDAVLKSSAVQNANPSMPSSYVNKFDNGQKSHQGYDSLQRVEVFSSRTTVKGPVQRASMPVLPSSNVHLPGVGLPRSNTQTRCEMHANAPPPGSYV